MPDARSPHSEREEALRLARGYDDGSLIASTNGAVKVARVLLDLEEQLEALQRELERRTMKTREARVAELEQIVADNERDARWIVGQHQRLQDEPVKEVALAIVERCASTPASTPDAPKVGTDA